MHTTQVIKGSLGAQVNANSIIQEFFYFHGILSILGSDLFMKLNTYYSCGFMANVTDHK